jgi:hypothetical protein
MKKITFLFFAVVFVLSVKAQTVYQTYVVTGNETWDLTTYPNGVDIDEQIIIESGGHLIINDITLRFRRKQSIGPGIVIEPGGVLEANGASFLPRFYYVPWLGIRVKGNPDFPYHDLTKQGLLLMDACHIESSSSAVHTDKGLSSPGGGTVIIKNSTFQDCTPSIRLGEAPLGLGLISGCTFLRTNAFPAIWNAILSNPEFVPPGLKLVATNARITNCSFIATWDNNPTGGMYAINVQGGDVKVKNNEVLGWLRGVDCRSLSPTDLISVTSNYMYCRDNNLCLTYNTNSLIVDNEFEIWEPARSVEFWYSTNYTFEQNNIIADQWYNQASGVEVRGTGLYSNEIYNNTFDNYWYGVLAHKNLVDEDHGLSIKCNEFTNNKYDIFVWGGPSGEGIYKYQGSMANHPNAPAGNLFSWYGPPAFDFVNNSSEHINYIHHHQSGLSHEPQNYTQQSITLIPNLEPNAQYNESLTCPSNFPPGGGFVPGDPNDPAIRMAGMIEANIAASEVENLIFQLKDGGNTPAMVSNINGSIPPEAYAIYLDLMAESPYLSKEAIEAAIDKEGVISNTMLRDIMVANPHAAKENELLESIDQRSTPMPDHMKAEIWSGLDVSSALENLESIRSFYSQKASRDHRFLVQHYMMDTLDEAASKQALVELLQMGIEPQAYYQLAFMHFNDGQLSQGEQVLNAVSASFDLNDFQTAELSSMQAYYQIRKQMQQNGQHLGNLNQNQLDAMMDIAEFGQGMAKGYACNILSLYGLCERPDDGGLKNQLADEGFLSSKKAIEYERLKNISTAHQHFTVSPNPARDYIAVQLTEEVLAGEATLNIYSAEGKLLKQHLMDANKSSAIIDVSSLPPGSYSIAFVRSGKQIDSSRFILAN